MATMGKFREFRPKLRVGAVAVIVIVLRATMDSDIAFIIHYTALKYCLSAQKYSFVLL